MLTITENQGVRYPVRIVLNHPLLRKQGFEYWSREKELIDCGLNDALDATTLLFAKRTDAERFVETITSDLLDLGVSASKEKPGRAEAGPG